MKTKKLLTALLALLLILPLALNASAEDISTSNGVSEQGSDTTLIIIVAVSLALLSIICVLIANKKSAKYRKAFKRRKKKK